MKLFLTRVAWVGFVVLGLVPMVFGQPKPGAGSRQRFVIRDLMPVVDAKMLDAVQAFVGLEEADIHASELLPPEKGGVTKTRVAVRLNEKGSMRLKIKVEDPSYRIYQIFEKFGVLTRVLSWAGAEHIFLESASFGGFTFQSDPSFPLHFKLVKDVGYVHLCGRGTVTLPGGRTYSPGEAEGLDDFIADMGARDQLAREAASEALGWLARTQADKDRVVPVLVKALKDHAAEVRRNAAASLGKIGDLRAREALKQTLQDEDEWVRQVAAYALTKIGTS